MNLDNVNAILGRAYTTAARVAALELKGHLALHAGPGHILNLEGLGLTVNGHRAEHHTGTSRRSAAIREAGRYVQALPGEVVNRLKVCL